MKEYIEREALLKDIEEMLNTAQQHINIKGRGLGKTLWTGIYKGINFCQTKLLAAPSADPIHEMGGCYCWECEEENNGYCKKLRGMPTIQIGFCGYGYRKKDREE